MNIKTYIFVAFVSAALLGGCSQSNPSEEYLDKLHSQPPQQQWETIRKIGGLSPSQLAKQADAIKGATSEQRARWKQEALSSGGAGAPGQLGPGSQNAPPPGVGGR